MKKSFLIITAAFITAMCLTGCLGENYENSNYHTLSSAEKSTIITSMAGSYSGTVIIPISSKDTLTADAGFTINGDTTLTLKFPISILANLVDTTRTMLHSTLAESGEQSINLKLYIPIAVYNSYWDSYWAQSCFTPTLYAENYTKTFSSGTKTIKLTFDTYLDILNAGYLFNFMYYDKQAQGYFRPLTVEVTDENGKTDKANLNATSVFHGKK